MPETEPSDHRGLTVRQPWAFAIAEGFKTVENRSRRTNYRGQLLIHAGLKHDNTVPVVRYSRAAAIRLDELGGSGNFWEARGLVPSAFSRPHATLALGAVIATARLAGCHAAVDGCCAPWGFPDVWHWQLVDVQPLRKAVPRVGTLGLWTPDPELLTAVADASVHAEDSPSRQRNNDGTSTGLTATVDGQPVPLEECGWIQRRPCGCIVSAIVAVSGNRVIATAQQAHEHLNKGKREQAAAEREGITVGTTELITMTHYRENIGANWECAEHSKAQVGR
ncbi:hypothetical protein [Streptomyces sp. NPDC002692]